MSDSRHAATVLVTSTPALFTEACARAADRLRKGELVALPTETVYGLAANALDPLAVERIYAAKGRPRRNPIIVHVASLELARECVATWPPEAEAFARAFWPGPLTLVLPRSARIPDVVTAGGDTVGIRWPNHPIIQSVLERCGFPLAAPSANPANRLSPTTARHVARELGNRIPLIIDGGRCQVGIESTVVDLTRRPALVLRPGMISLAALQAIAPTVELAENPAGGQLRSPGLLPKHYAPRGRLMLVRWADDRQLSRQISALGSSPARCQIIAFDRVPREVEVGRVAVVPNDPEAYARALYAELHRCDEEQAEVILVEEPPAGLAWQGIRDRLRRASA